jgi:hypothetical protein
MKITPNDRAFLIKAFWSIAGLSLVWCTTAIYRTTITKSVDLPIIGKISYSGAILISIPVLSFLFWLLSVILILFSRSVSPDRRQTFGRLLPIFGPLSRSMRPIAAFLTLALLLYLNVIITILFLKMTRMDMVSRDGGTVLHLHQQNIFQKARDWRWIDPQDSNERPSAYPVLQPNAYRLSLMLNWCWLLAIVISVWPYSRKQSHIHISKDIDQSKFKIDDS